jgi:septum site-determining protein MinC
MSIDSQKTPNTPLALEFKSSTFSVPVLVLSSDNLVVIEQQLQEKISLAPEFFRNSPLVLDLQEINKQGYDIDIVALTDIIRKAGLLPIGIRGGNVQQNKQAIELLLPVYSIHSGGVSADTQKPKTIIPVPETKTDIDADVDVGVDVTTTTLITQPIRSGQRLYAAGDLVILAQVSAGAEIMAEGNIHVYNTLRGRALAGVRGNTEARIFCFDLQAELISIAGNYKVSEDLDESVRNKPVQIYLQDQALIIKDIVQHH